MQDAINSFIAKARHDSPVGVLAQEDVSMELLMAMLSHDKTRLSFAFDKAKRWGQAWTDPNDIVSLLATTNDIVQNSPYSAEELLKLAEETCFGNIVDIFKEKNSMNTTSPEGNHSSDTISNMKTRKERGNI